MTVYVDKLVLMDHPHLYDTHVIGKVVSQTSRTVHIMHWKSRINDFDDEAKRRTINSSFRIIHEDVSQLHADQINKLADQLVSAQAEMIRRKREAEIAYHKTIQGLKIL